MQTVRQLLGSKSPQIHSVSPEEPVIHAIRVMAEQSIGAVVVLDGGRLAGILSERDYARKVVLKDRSSATTRVREIMTAELVTVAPTATVEHCLQLVTEHRIRHLPVVSDDALVGVISIGDLVKAVIEEQQRELGQLKDYITGS